MTDLPPDIEEQLAGMPEGDWSALVARLRAPDSTERFRAIAAQVLSGDALDAFTNTADTSKFVGDNGHIDEDKVMGHLTALFGVGPQTDQQQRQWGQHSGPIPGDAPGSGGKAEAAKRFGTDHEPSPINTHAARGAAGRAEAERRFGSPEGRQQR